MNRKKQKSSSSRLKFSARVLLDGRHGYFAGITALTAFCNFFLNTILSSVFSGSGVLNLILQLACSVLMNMIFYILLVGQQRIYLNLCRDEVYGIGDLFSSFTGSPEQIAIYSVLQYILQAVMLNATTYVAFAIWTVDWGMCLIYLTGILIGLILYVWVQLTLNFVLCLFVDHPYITAKEAVIESFHMMSGSRGKLLRIYISFLGLDLLCLLSFGIGSLLVEPYQNATLTLFYMKQCGEKETEPHADGDTYENV